MLLTIGIYCEKTKLIIDNLKELEQWFKLLASFICHMEWHGQMKSKPQER